MFKAPFSFDGRIRRINISCLVLSVVSFLVLPILSV